MTTCRYVQYARREKLLHNSGHQQFLRQRVLVCVCVCVPLSRWKIRLHASPANCPPARCTHLALPSSKVEVVVVAFAEVVVVAAAAMAVAVEPLRQSSKEQVGLGRFASVIRLPVCALHMQRAAGSGN